MSKTRRNHVPQFKTKLVLEALAGEKTIHEVAAKHQIHPNQVTQWRRQLIDQAAEVFGKPAGEAPAGDRETLLARIEELTVQNDFFRTSARQVTPAERLQSVEHHHPELPVTRQRELLAAARSTVYYPRGPLVSDYDLRLMRRLCQ